MDATFIPASARLPTELLLAIFSRLTSYQDALHACILTCRRWSQIAIPLLWKQPYFSRISKVSLFAFTLVSTSSGQTPSPYAKLINTLSFSGMPECDRNNPRLGLLLDTIISCMAVRRSEQPGCLSGKGWQEAATAPMIKRSRSLSRTTENTGCTRPLITAVDVGIPGDSAAVEAAAATVAGNHTVAHLSRLDGFQEEPPALSLTMDSAQPSYDQHMSTCPSILRLASSTADHTYMSSLQNLDLSFCKGTRNYMLQRLAPKLASLQVLNLAGGQRTDITVSKLAQHMPGVRRVSIAWTMNLSDFGVSELVQKCRAVSVLDLTYCTQIEDTALFSIAHCLKDSLMALSVAYCAGVTDIGVREVATSCGRLEVLNLVKCLRVTERMRRFLEGMNVVTQCDTRKLFSINYGVSNKRK
ncbi:hypothetical protein BX661DRAFT_187418 [Kickxella alabastrina]|uniref:uncharacterized protein n=1 Tax=Kickxella alabastrina TaxID=61397 RepID=UPI00222121C1|nr:uncharacterized protein BX661DRAFT_187418 [Kickxella alabastrina]KAI7822450.1 hypothetical protein BX661DRAFT_187418 [Kickxella alabastrina]